MIVFGSWNAEAELYVRRGKLLTEMHLGAIVLVPKLGRLAAGRPDSAV